MKGIRGKPKPYGGSRPLIMNAGASPVGQAFAIRNCDAFFLQASRTSLDETAQKVADAKEPGEGAGQGARRLYGRRRHLQADQEGGRGLLSPLASSSTPTGRRSTASWRSRTSRAQNTPPEQFQQIRTGYAAGAWAGSRSSAIPTTWRSQLIDLSKAGLTGIAVSLVNYADELPYFCDEVLPRLERAGLREKR